MNIPLVLFFVSAPECRDIETALYDHTYVFSVLCSIFQYVIKQWLRTLQLSEHKSDYGCLWIYLPGPWIHYQDYEYWAWTVRYCFPAPSCTQDCSQLS